MLGIGMQEILIILVVALIVIGPKRLPELARTLGKGFAEFRKAADDIKREMNDHTSGIANDLKDVNKKIHKTKDDLMG